MSQDKVFLTAEQGAAAQIALDRSALNGIMFLAASLHSEGHLTSEDLQRMHEWMSRPLSVDVNAANPLVQRIQQELDQQFSTLLQGK